MAGLAGNMTSTTSLSYSENWRVIILGCGYIIALMTIALCLIVKYELIPCERRKLRPQQEVGDQDQGVVFAEDIWKPCCRAIHPAWLLLFRLSSCFTLFSVLFSYAIEFGLATAMFNSYTSLTTTLSMIYFGIGSVWTFFAYCHHEIKSNTISFNEELMEVSITPNEGGDTIEEHTAQQTEEITTVQDEDGGATREQAGFFGYIFQIMFQMLAGAVVLTFLSLFFLIGRVDAHYFNPYVKIRYILYLVNVVFFLVESLMSSLKFPWYRIAYFILYTCLFISINWINHMRKVSRWGYFVAMPPDYPIWYWILLPALHFVCYGVFVLVMYLKHKWLLKRFRNSRGGASQLVPRVEGRL